MISLEENKRFVLLHAEILGVAKKVFPLLNTIQTMDDDPLKGWANVFMNEAEILENKCQKNKALGFYNLARFPYPYTEKQKEAYKKYLQLFKELYVDTGYFELKTTKANQVPFYYFKGTNDRIVIICGGIISLKEQWFRMASVIRNFGFSVILSEMPGVGENDVFYDKSAFGFFSMLLDAIQCPVHVKCQVIGLSFSGYLALQNSVFDKRIDSITMVGTPVEALYHDYDTFKKLPAITKNIITYNLNRMEKKIIGEKDLFCFFNKNFPSLPVLRDDLRIFYVRSEYDEIISKKEIIALKNTSNQVNELCLPDVHGSPNYHKTVILYLLLSVLEGRDRRDLVYCFIKHLLPLTKYFYHLKNYIRNKDRFVLSN